VTTGNTPPQFILSAANMTSIQQQALIQQLLQQNALVIGCNSLLLAPADRQTNALPISTVKTESDVKNLAGSPNACYGTSEVCVNV